MHAKLTAADGTPDECQDLADCDKNGTPDVLASEDCNANNVPDRCELAGNDCDGNGIPDECDPDCDSDGTPDACEAAMPMASLMIVKS